MFDEKYLKRFKKTADEPSKRKKTARESSSVDNFLKNREKMHPEVNLEQSSQKQDSGELYTVVWEGFKPTKPFPTELLQKYEDPTRGKNVKWSYNKSKSMWHYNIKPDKPDDKVHSKKQKVQDTASSIVDRVDSPENEPKSVGVITRSKSSMFKPHCDDKTIKQNNLQLVPH